MVLIPTSITLMIFSWGVGLVSDPFKVQEVFVDADVLMPPVQSADVAVGEGCSSGGGLDGARHAVLVSERSRPIESGVAAAGASSSELSGTFGTF